MSHWAVKYIGLPYRLGGRTVDGLDCWGLLQVIYRVERRVLLPDMPGVAGCDLRVIARVLAEQVESSKWVEISKPEDGCAVAMSQRGALHHVGVWADVDGGKVIHCREGVGVVAETLWMLRLCGFKTIQFYGLHH